MNGYISRETKPAWYELSLRGDHTIRISIHRAAYAALSKFDWPNAPAVVHLGKIFKMDSFIPPSEGPWGFGNIFRTAAPPVQGWLAWDCALPKLKARAAGGKGESPEGYTTALRSSLNILMTALWLFEGNTESENPQLMVFEGIELPGGPDDSHFSSGGLSVTLGRPVIEWISKWISIHGDGGHIPEVVEAMKAASEYIWENSSGHGGHGRFGAMCRRPKWLNLDVPGDACGLDPGNYYDESLDTGYTLQPHNVDGSLQQLTFLAGLARLHDLVRADQTSKKK